MIPDFYPFELTMTRHRKIGHRKVSPGIRKQTTSQKNEKENMKKEKWVKMVKHPALGSVDHCSLKRAHATKRVLG